MVSGNKSSTTVNVVNGVGNTLLPSGIPAKKRAIGDGSNQNTITHNYTELKRRNPHLNQRKENWNKRETRIGKLQKAGAARSAQDNGQEASEPKAALVQALKKIARPTRTFDKTGQ